MVFPSGIETATLRIQEIRQRFEAMEQATYSPPQTEDANYNTFGRILNSKLSPDKAINPTTADRTRLEAMVQRQAQKAGLDPELVKAVVQAESGFNPNAVSQAGAKGLMQLMPETAQSLGVRSILNPTQNVEGGTRYLKSLMDRYQSVPLALAAYNAGPGAVDRYGGIPPYRETQTYVQRVLQYQQQYEARAGE